MYDLDHNPRTLRSLPLGRKVVRPGHRLNRLYLSVGVGVGLVMLGAIVDQLIHRLA